VESKAPPDVDGSGCGARRSSGLLRIRIRREVMVHLLVMRLQMLLWFQGDN
jgi:hypothetical protein